METKTKIIIGASAVVGIVILYFIFRPKASVARVTIPSDWVNFDWVGNNSNGAGGRIAGIHCFPNYPYGTVSGSKVEIQVTQGDSSYNGVFTVYKTGADDNSYANSILLINTPYTGKAASGQLRLVG